MKSEFMLAFDEICEARDLSKEVVIEALKTALVSAYRRNTNVSNVQEVNVDIDQRSGEAKIFAEKEVVDSIFDNRTEVLLSEAKQAGFPEIELGDMVLVDSTPANFGRIAAQTAKQVILQRVREAEREKLYEDFSAREGEIINGTVQSVSGQNITIGLGRTEAILPRSQQVPRERYRAHDKIRVFVLEVRRTNKGPQIIVSRNHRSLLRRLLELEVPEIYNGQVDIKSIAREAGARSKVAVVAMQPGIDPVGACVGMRGVRIQSIVRELSEEKIDVIEWDPDQRTFIAKALSPARVSQVFLEDHPDEGKTAIVIVPDDQLSLAIGREGQNARLAAKLTGWRIDIKSLTEAAIESLTNLDHKEADPSIVKNRELIGLSEVILAKKASNRPITSEDYMTLNRLVSGIEGHIVSARTTEHERIQRARNSAGDLLLRLEMEDDTLLDIAGFGAKALEEVQAALDAHRDTWETEELEEQEDSAETIEGEVEEGVEEVPEDEVAELIEEPALEGVAPAELLDTEEAIVEVAATEIDEEEISGTAPELPIDDLGVSLVKEPEQIEEKPKKRVVVVRSGPSLDEEEEDEEKSKQRARELVFDEERGKVVAKRKRKKSRHRPEWQDFDDMEVDELLDEII